MTALFGRTSSLLIGNAGETGKVFSGLRIAFSVKKSEAMPIQDAKVTINNLSQDSRSFIQKGMTLILKAGYAEGNGEQTVFSGDISRVSHDITPPDITTEIDVKDGLVKYHTSKISKSYTAGSKITDVLNDAMKSANCPEQYRKDTIDRFPKSDKKYNNGFVADGYTVAILDTISKELDFNWSFQNGSLKIYPAGESDGDSAVVLSAESGMIGSPKRLEKTETITPDLSESTIPQRASEKTKSFDGWEIVSLLQPLVEPGSVVELRVAGAIAPYPQYRVAEVEHKGDTHGQDWTSTIRVKD